jgi:uncharacterized protein YraI
MTMRRHPAMPRERTTSLIGRTLAAPTRRIAIAAMLVAGTAALTMGTAGAAHAADTLCNVNQNAWVRSGPGTQYGVYYTIPAGGGFRTTGPRSGGWVLGHAGGMNDGFIPNDGRLYNC